MIDANASDTAEVVVDEAAGILDQLEAVIAGAEQVEAAAPNVEPEVKAEIKAEPATAVEVKAESTVAAKPEVKPEVKVEAPDPAAERSLARLVAREEAISKRESEIADTEKRHRTLVSQFRRNPVEAFKALGFDDAEVPQVIRAAMATQLSPDKVPAQYKQIQERLTQEDRFRAQESELQTLRNELAQKDSAQKQQAAVAQYHTETKTYLATAEADAPNLAKLFKAKPDLALRRVFDVVQADAKSKLERAGKGEDVQPLTPAEAARAVEAELAEYAEMLGVTAVTATSASQATNAAKGKPSLSNRATQPTSVRQGASAVKIDEFDAQSEVDSWMKSVGL